jgi:hypothetical protein
MKRLIGAAVCSLHKSKMLAPTTGALVGAVFSGVPGAIAGAGLAGAVAKSFQGWSGCRMETVIKIAMMFEHLRPPQVIHSLLAR